MAVFSDTQIRFLLERADWIPFLSSFSNIYHIFNRSQNMRGQDSAYAYYLRERTLLVHVGLLIPVLNVVTQVYQQFFSDKPQIINRIRIYGRNYALLDNNKRLNFDYTYQACLSCYPVLSQAPRLMQDHDLIVKCAIKSDQDAYIHASARLKRSKSLILYTLSFWPDVFQHIPQDLKEDLDIIDFALEKDGRILRFLSSELQNNPNIVLKALKIYAVPIIYASIRLQKSKEFLLEAIKQHPGVLTYLDEEFYYDREFISLALKTNGLALQFIDESWKDESFFVDIAITQNPHSIDFASKRMRMCY